MKPETEKLLAEAKANFEATRNAPDAIRRAGFRRYMEAMDVADKELNELIYSKMK